MITIEHYHDAYGPYAFAFDTYKGLLPGPHYVTGYGKPNYPMPALTLPATYHPLTGWSAWQIATEQDQD